MTCQLLLLAIKAGELLAKACDLRQVVDHYVRLIRMVNGVVLMIALSFVECFQGVNLRCDAAIEDLRLVELIDISFCNVLLFVIRVKDRGAILRSNIGPLPIQLSWIVRN